MVASEPLFPVISSNTGGGGGGSGTPGGADTNVQYNDGGSFGGDANLVWAKSDRILTIFTYAGADGFLVRAASENGISISPGNAGGASFVQGNNSDLTGDGPIAFNPGGGNVGVGIADPAQLLHVNGMTFSNEVQQLLGGDITRDGSGYIQVLEYSGGSVISVVRSGDYINTLTRSSKLYTFTRDTANRIVSWIVEDS